MAEDLSTPPRHAPGHRRWTWRRAARGRARGERGSRGPDSLAVAAVAALVLLPAGAAPARTLYEAGVCSGFTIGQGQVAFRQADGSVTALDLRTGAVVSRGRPEDRPCDPGGAEVLPATGERVYAVGEGRLTLRHAAGSLRDVIDVQFGATRWTGVPAYAHGCCGGGLATAAAADGRLLVGTTRGQVECIDLATGRSVWLYAFHPYTAELGDADVRACFLVAHCDRQYLSERIVRFRSQIPPVHTIAGTALVPFEPRFVDPGLVPAVTVATRVVVDPAPVSPFRDYPFLLARAFSPVALLGLLLGLAWTRRLGSRDWQLGLAALALFGYAISVLLLLGRVAPSATVSVKATLGVLVAFLAHRVWRLLAARRRLLAAPFALALLAAGLVLVLALAYL